MNPLDEKAISTKKLAIVLAAVIASASAFTYLAPAWNTNLTGPDISANITNIPDITLFGVKEIDPNVFVTIAYTTDFNITTVRYRSSSIKYESDNRSLLVYEHGAKIWNLSDAGPPNTSLDSLIPGDVIDIPIFIADDPGTIKTQGQAAGIVFHSINRSRSVTHLKYVNITMDTHYPEAWGYILRSVNTSKTKVYVGGNSIAGYKVYINTTAGNEISLPDETVAHAKGLYKGVVRVR